LDWDSGRSRLGKVVDKMNRAGIERETIERVFKAIRNGLENQYKWEFIIVSPALTVIKETLLAEVDAKAAKRAEVHEIAGKLASEPGKAPRVPKFQKGEVVSKIEAGMVVDELDSNILCPSRICCVKDGWGCDENGNALYVEVRSRSRLVLVLAEDFYGPEPAKPEPKKVVYKAGTRPPILRKGMKILDEGIVLEVLEVQGDRARFLGESTIECWGPSLKETDVLAEDFEEVVA
jgi:hypothetical protein